MTIGDFFANNKDYKPYVLIQEYFSGETLFDGWVISIPEEINKHNIHYWKGYDNEYYVIFVKNNY